MFTDAAIWFTASAIVCLLLFLLVRIESGRGGRLFASGFRSWLDRIIDSATGGIKRRWRHFVKYIVQLHWYYSIHSVLKAALRVIVAVYAFIENEFERNRLRAKLLRAEKKKRLSTKTHLDQIEEHKQETALTPAQQKQLKKKVLEGKD